jgi:hypothetical protein
MALVRTLHLEHLPSSHAIHIALYRDIKNATFLQQQLLAGNTDFEYALIDAGVVSLSSSFLFLASSISYHPPLSSRDTVTRINSTDEWVC